MAQRIEAHHRHGPRLLHLGRLDGRLRHGHPVRLRGRPLPPNPGPADFWALPWDLSPKKAKEVLFEHRVLTANEAREYGFVNRVYPDSELEAQTLAYAERVADNDPRGVRAAKYAINQTLDNMGYSASVTNALHASSMFGFAGATNEPHNAYASFASAHDNPHTNRVRDAFARFREDQSEGTDSQPQ